MSAQPDVEIRFPRPIKRFPRNPLNEQSFFEKTLKDIYPILIHSASKIKRPHYLDPEDLVQNAYIKILKHKNKYDASRNAAVVTWLIGIAVRDFYTTVHTEYLQKRNPGTNLIRLDEIGDLFENNINEYNIYKHTKDNKFSPFSSEIEYKMRMNDLLNRINIRLPVFENRIFQILLEPPTDLVEKLRKEFKYGNDFTKCRSEFKITKNALAEYLNTPVHKITKAKNVIGDAILRAIED